MTTFAANFKKLRKHLKLSQEAAAEALNVTQAAVSKWENGGEIKRSTINLISNAFNARAEWLEYGTGDMLNPGANIVDEPLNSNADPYSDVAIAERFILVTQQYMAEFNLTQKDLCLKWHINDKQFSDALNGRKDVSMSMMGAALRYGNINANYLLGGVGPRFERDYVNNEIKKLTGMIEELQHPTKEKKRA